MTENRTNEPTPEQVEAAAKAHRMHGKGDEYAGIICRECDEYFEDRAGFDAHRMRAALEAAAGVTPQALSEPWVEAVNRALYRYDNDESFGVREVASALAAPVQPSSKVQDSPEIENPGSEFSIPVKPSSTVDEGEAEHVVEEVIRSLVDLPLSTRLVLARAVVEAIGGDSRGV